LVCGFITASSSIHFVGLCFAQYQPIEGE